jgi:hypothetical protein
MKIEIGPNQNANTLAGFNYSNKVCLVLPASNHHYNLVFDLLVGILGISKEFYSGYVDQVIQLKETGVFYPKFDICLYPPVFFLNAKFQTGFEESELLAIFKDCLDANEKYLKKENIVFLVPKDLNINLKDVKVVIQKAVDNYFKNRPESFNSPIFCKDILICN